MIIFETLKSSLMQNKIEFLNILEWPNPLKIESYIIADHIYRRIFLQLLLFFWLSTSHVSFSNGLFWVGRWKITILRNKIPM